MMKPITFDLPGNKLIAEKITSGINGEKGDFILRQFPDGETYLRVLSSVEGREIIVICTLHEPDHKLLPLLFLCNLLKDLKVKSITLVAPYLAYMRQDKQFNNGEAVTSVYFAKLLSSFADRLITIDPHLHRRTSLREIYSIPCSVLHADELVSEWIKNNINDALLVGPDMESEQWVQEISKKAGVPYIILEKMRHGDRNVDITVPNVEQYKKCTPVLMDDIISTGQTMIQTIGHLKKAGMKDPVCIGIHAVFSENSYEGLMKSGAARVVTSNTIKHETNAIDVSEVLVQHFLLKE